VRLLKPVKVGPVIDGCRPPLELRRGCRDPINAESVHPTNESIGFENPVVASTDRPEQSGPILVFNCDVRAKSQLCCTSPVLKKSTPSIALVFARVAHGRRVARLH
jgi:hypothetical protein